MSRNIDFSINEYYHLYNRGVDKRTVFMDAEDYKRFTALLYLANNTNSVHMNNLNHRGLTSLDVLSIEKGDTLVDIGAYCLMPNHFHVLVREKIESGISIFMQKVMTGYTMYFNKKYKRTGALFGGTFKAQHVARDTYLKYLFAYIHLNPIKLVDSNWKENGISDKKKAERYLNSYLYSSYLDFKGTDREEKSILNKDAFPQYFSTNVEFRSFVSWWLNFKDEK
ncbi:MAG: transposase [bacterium]|nr:transposase [bacterium]